MKQMTVKRQVEVTVTPREIARGLICEAFRYCRQEGIDNPTEFDWFTDDGKVYVGWADGWVEVSEDRCAVALIDAANLIEHGEIRTID